MYKCSVSPCWASFSLKDSLRRHFRTVHGNEKPYSCNICSSGKTFRRLDNYVRHLRTVHPEETFTKESLCDKPYYECAVCDQKYKRRDHLIRHISNKHQHNGNNQYECDTCGIQFRSKSSVSYHIKKFHLQCTELVNQIPKKKPRNKKSCVLCRTSYDTRIEVLHHYRKFHDINLAKTELQFDSEEEFCYWKREMEIATNTRFITFFHHKYNDGSTLSLFFCHRSGDSKIKEFVRKRRLKLEGSKKIGGICPAEIRCRYTFKDKYFVTFCSTHIGHSMKSDEEFYHKYLFKEDAYFMNFTTSANSLQETKANSFDSITDMMDVVIVEEQDVWEHEPRSLENTQDFMLKNKNHRIQK